MSQEQEDGKRCGEEGEPREPKCLLGTPPACVSGCVDRVRHFVFVFVFF